MTATGTKKRRKKKAAKKSSREPVAGKGADAAGLAERPLGFIDAKTPIGTVFQWKCGPGMQTEDLIFHGFHGSRVELGFSDGSLFEGPTPGLEIEAERWNRLEAANVVAMIPPGQAAGDNPQSTIDNRQSTIPAPDLVAVPIDAIAIEPQPRTDFDETALFDLQASIAELGPLQPIVVIDTKHGGYLLVVGERRLRALKATGAKHVRAMVYGAADVDRKTLAKMRLAENFQRRDLNHMETARALGEFREAGASVKEIAAETHKSVDWVREHLDLLRLDVKIQAIVATGRLPIKQAAMIARVGDKDRQLNIARSAIGKGYGDSLEKAAGSSDYIKPMSHLRSDIAYALKTLGSCGWPMDVDYAGRGSCLGCIDNTASDAVKDLFGGVNLPGKSKKGNCTNRACFDKKATTWDRDPAKKARDKARAKAKADKEARHRSEAIAAGRDPEAAVSGKKPDRKFPLTPEEHFAVQLHEYGEAVLKAIRSWIAGTPLGKIPADASACILQVLYASFGGEEYEIEFYISPEKKDLPPCDKVVFVLQSDLPMAEPGGFLGNLAHSVDLNFRPDYSRWSGEVRDVPVPDATIGLIDCLEALASRWGIDLKEIGDRPDFDGVKAELVAAAESERVETLTKLIVRGKKAEATAAIESCTDVDLLKKIVADGKAGKGPCGKLAVWRAKKISERIAELLIDGGPGR